MSDAAVNGMNQQLHPGFFDKLLMWFAWVLAGVVFFSIGWSVMAPTDPHGAVSLLARSGDPAMLLKACALAGLTAVVATILAGRYLPDAGVFAASVGMVAVSVRGDTAAYFLIRRADESSSIGGLALSLAGESAVWFGVIVLTIFVCHALVRSFPAVTIGAGRHYLTQIPSGFDLFRAKPQKVDAPKVPLTSFAVGIKHAVVVGGVGLVAFQLFSSGVAGRSIQHGQACFVVAASTCVACYIGHRFAPVSSALWSLVGVLVITIVGYIWSSFSVNAAALPASIPASAFLRVLPIQYVATGTATAVAMCWYMRDPDFGIAREVDDATLESPRSVG